jgi:cytoskeletal protein CcmA (bactofilin family)
MANNLGRISGQLLKDNLTRNGHDLSFHAALLTGDDPVLKLNVTNRYVSINTDSTSKDLFVNSVTQTKNLIIDPVLLNGLQGKSSLKISISGNTIVSTQDLNLSAATQVNANIIDTDNIRIDGRVISTTTLNTNLDLSPAGSLEIYNNLNVTGNLWAKETAPGNGTGKITLDGNITFGSTDQSGANADTISFAADINTDIIPDLNETYRIGSNIQRWEGLYTELVNGEQTSTLALSSSGVNLVLRPGKIWYVATTGLDTNVGNHQSGPFATIKHALAEASAGDTVHIYPGTYTEEFPLTVKTGVTVKGTGIRSVTVQPTVPTQSNNAFLLNGETTVSDLSVKDFYAPGCAFSFAPGFTVSTRSPYVQNITVLTNGSVTSPSDPRGFDEGDAGGGAYVDGSLATPASKEASMLFHSVTFITPGVDALTMTNGVRVEWLNSFTYFANIGLHATRGTTGRLSYVNPNVNLYIPNAYGLRTPALTEPFFRATQTSWEAGGLAIGAVLTNNTQFSPNSTITDVQGPFTDFGQDYYIIFTSTLPLIDFNPNDLVTVTANASTETKFGAEVRSIGSANIYGNYGAVADGADTLMYLIQHNFAYIGAGKDVTNDPSLNIAENETVEIALGKIYYQSLDNRGNFRVGDAFRVSFDTGLVTINGVSVSAGGVSSINFANGTAETVIDAGQVTTGNINFSGNLLTTLSGAVNLDSGTNEINLNANTSVTNNLDIIGNLSTDGTLTIGNAYIDIVRFTAPVEFALRPKTDDDFTLGGPTNKRWDKVYLDTSYIGSYKLDNATISTLPTNADIELRANSTGKIYIPTNNVRIVNDLTVNGITNFGDNALTAAATVTGTIDHTGLLDRTGDTAQTGTYNQTGYLDVSSNVQIADVTFINKTISTVTLDSNLELGAASTGKVKIPSADVKIDHNLYVTGNIQADSVITNTDITTDVYNNGNIEISLDLITTTLTDSDLEFRATGTGKVYASQDNVKFDLDLTVDGTTALRTTNITGAITQYGDYIQI